MAIKQFLHSGISFNCFIDYVVGNNSRKSQTAKALLLSQNINECNITHLLKALGIIFQRSFVKSLLFVSDKSHYDGLLHQFKIYSTT